jgi:dihydropteroate synthase type 2
MDSVHARGPATKVKTDPETVRASIGRFFTERLGALKAAGIGHERLIIDPGLSYFLGSNLEPSLAVMAGLGRLQARFGAAVLVSLSRKSFLRNITGRGLPDIGPASLAAELYAASQGVDYVRTHDVATLRDASLSIIPSSRARLISP